LDWEDGMSVGVESLDVHHRQTMRRIRHLANAVSEGSVDNIRSSLRFLQGYLAGHHAEEERWMDDAGYPGAREHARLHGELLERIRAAREEEPRVPEMRVREAAAAVARALEAHMRFEDLKLGRFFTARENLRLLAEAGPGVGASLTPIPGSLAAVSVVRAGKRDEAQPPSLPPLTKIPS